MAGRKLDSEAASMFEEEEFDKAYRGNVTSTPEASDAVDDEDDEDDDIAESPEDDEAAWASAEAEAATKSVEETDAATAEEEDEDDSDDDEDEEETEDDEDAEVSAAKDILSKRRGSTVAKKRGDGMTKAEMIRDEIEKRKKSGDSLRACDIISSLSDKGVEVNASQVSVTLRNMGVPSGPRGRTAKPKAAAGEKPTRGRRPKAEPASERPLAHYKQGAAKTPKAAPSSNGEAFTETEILATSDFVTAVGGAERGTALLRIFSRMNG